MPYSISTEGKTKIIEQITPDDAHIRSKDDITAGDGKKHDLLSGKAALSTRTTSNVFRLLKTCGLPVAFHEQIDPVTFSAPFCRMLPWEVVVRREAHGSYCKRFPHIQKGARFADLVVEFYLKTKGREWEGNELPCDDPLADIRYDGVYLYEPSKPVTNGTYFLRLNNSDVYLSQNDDSYFPQMAVLAQHAFLVLEYVFAKHDLTLCDYKVEFGVSTSDRLLLADVIDNDSWRVTKDGVYLDKQIYRDGGALETVLESYQLIADITESFPYQTLDACSLVNSKLVRWRA